jgi:prephenate dehydrogenase
MSSTLRIIAFQVCKPWTGTGDQCIFGLGLDGRVYTYDMTERHWNVVTTRRVNPLHKQPRRQTIIREEGEEK